jgi:CubicO group peptidase (beta-lactamase class C family)
MAGQHLRPRVFSEVQRLLERAVARGAFPAATIEVGSGAGPLWQQSFGFLTGESGAPATCLDSVFDLASLTKVLSTTALVMRSCEEGSLELDDDVGRHVEAWPSGERASVRLRDLLSHCSGLPAYVPFFRSVVGQAAFERAICDTPLEYQPRSRAVYSDLGFMLLGFILGRQVPLDERFRTIRRDMEIVGDLQFEPPMDWSARVVPTEFDQARGRFLKGEVHDENAAALGGVAGHAGLFGTAAAVGQHARHLIRILDGAPGAFQRKTVEDFVSRRADIPNSSRALGWDTMLPTSSCGRRMSARAFGHTGFTGTSLWVDPERAVYVVFLTNRVCPSRDNDAIRLVRPELHDLIMAALDSTAY